VHAGVGGSGAVGVVCDWEGPVVLLRADMGPRLVAEATGLELRNDTAATDAAAEATKCRRCRF